MRNDAKGSPPVGVWALALGAVGFLCGFFGPIEQPARVRSGLCRAHEGLRIAPSIGLALEYGSRHLRR
jgi:hypothetical protein